MKRVVLYIKTNVKFLGAIMVAAAVGGLTTALVSASIPDSNGAIHGCYRNASTGILSPKGALRVIDTDNGEACTSQETALDWSQNGGGGGVQTAYAHITGSPGAGLWDTARSKDVTNMSFVNAVPGGGYGACITVAFEPKNISVSGVAGLPAIVAVRNTGLNSADNGWSDANANATCGSTANAFFAGMGNDSSVFLTFTR